RGPEPMIYGAASFIVAVALASGFAVGVNLTTLAISEGSASAHHFTESPVMPGLAWNTTPPTDVEPDPYQQPPAVAGTDPVAPQDPTPHGDPAEATDTEPPPDTMASGEAIDVPSDPSSSAALSPGDAAPPE